MQEKTDSAYKILVVDDDQNTCLLTKTELTRRGCIVETANDGLDAICKIFHFEPHIVILDVWMPGLEGKDLVKTIKAYRNQVGIFMVSASKNEKVKAECLLKGAFAYFEKPVDIDLLYNKIKEFFEQEKMTPPPSLSEYDLQEVEMVLKLLEKKGLMARNDVVGEFTKLRKQNPQS